MEGSEGGTPCLAFCSPPSSRMREAAVFATWKQRSRDMRERRIRRKSRCGAHGHVVFHTLCLCLLAVVRAAQLSVSLILSLSIHVEPVSVSSPRAEEQVPVICTRPSSGQSREGLE